jgi:hypothetical protein
LSNNINMHWESTLKLWGLYVFLTLDITYLHILWWWYFRKSNKFHWS